jgi:hypothetical protein
MPNPPLERPSPPQQPRGSWISIFLALMFGAVVVVILTFITLGTFAPVLVIGGILFLFVGLHYCLWGWWLGGVIRQAEGEEEEADEEE